MEQNQNSTDTANIVRKVDDLGRVVLPKELRSSFGIADGDPLEISTQGDYILLHKYTPACNFCGEHENNLKEFQGKFVCGDCIGALVELP